MAPNVLKSILRWRLVEGNVQIDIKTKFGYKQYRLKIVEEKKSVMTKEWTRIDRWLRHHLFRTKCDLSRENVH